jgi:signal transduction histidine kinase
MDNKKTYIQFQESRDYAIKAKNSGYAQFMSAIFFYFLHDKNSNSTIYIALSVVSIIIIIAIRTRIINDFLEKNQNNIKAVEQIDVTSYISGFCWTVIGISTINSFSILSVEILILFVLLIAFSLGSILSLSHRKLTLIIFNFFALLPLLYYSVLEFERSREYTILWLVGFSIINFFYILKQSKSISDELRLKFSNEFELMKSLKEIELSKKNLEEESIKTFHASRLSSLGEMAGGVAHEINNPLTIILGQSKSLLMHDNDFNELVRNKVLKINQAGDRIAKIVKGMKIVASKNDGCELEDISVSKILELSISLFEERIKTENIIFSIENFDDPIIHCNSLQVSQIVINLISNALDEVSKQTSDRFLKIQILRNNNFSEIAILNSGPLLEQKIVDKIFEPFYTTKQLGKGTGLGLSISKTLATNNNGQLLYEPMNGHICFKLIIPAIT